MLEFVVVGEAAADARIACDLIDRVVTAEGPEWIRVQDRDYFIRELLPGMRRWAGLEPNQPHSSWRDVRQLGQNFPQLTPLRRITDSGQKPERLSQTSNPARDPKKILSRLTDDNYEREKKCWTDTPLATLRERGAETQMNAFLDEIADRLSPLFSK